MEDEVQAGSTRQDKGQNYKPLVIGLSITINLVVLLLFFTASPETDPFTSFDLTLLPRLNALFNSFTFVFLLAAYYMIRKKDIKNHRRFVYAAFTTTALFLVSYLIYHTFAPTTSYGGQGLLRYVYYTILITHVLLAIVIVPLSLTTLFRGLNREIRAHRRIARWTLPLWLYVSSSGVIVYLMIAPYYQ